MSVRLVFLGRLEDAAGGAEREAPAQPFAALVAGLGAELARAVSAPRIRVARNGALVADPAALILADGDEIAFLPPVSGG